MECNLRVGDKVVCVWNRKREANESLFSYIRNLWILRHKVYTVSFVKACAGGVAIDLVEAPHPNAPIFYWRADKFRKIETRDLSAWLKTSAGDTARWDKRRKVKPDA